MALEALDIVFLELVGLELLCGNFAQGNDRVFVAVAVDQRLGAARKLPGPVGREQHEIKAVGNLVDTVFNGYARHQVLIVEGSLAIYSLDFVFGKSRAERQISLGLRQSDGPDQIRAVVADVADFAIPTGQSSMDSDG